jgi:hypothetical protein
MITMYWHGLISRLQGKSSDGSIAMTIPNVILWLIVAGSGCILVVMAPPGASVATGLHQAGPTPRDDDWVQPTQTAPNLLADAEAAVNRFIKSQESGARTEYKEGRKIVIGDLNDDGSPDLAVLYTLEGTRGNYYDQYLAVFLSVNGKYVYKVRRRVGGRLERNMDLKSIENGKVLFDTLEYLPGDTSCCPSKKGSAQFKLAESRLVEVKPQSSR